MLVTDPVCGDHRVLDRDHCAEDADCSRPVLIGEENATDIVLYEVAANGGVRDALEMHRFATVVRLISAQRIERPIRVVVDYAIVCDRDAGRLYGKDAFEARVLDRKPA